MDTKKQINQLPFPPNTKFVKPDSDLVPVLVGSTLYKAMIPNVQNQRNLYKLIPSDLPNPSSSTKNNIYYVTYDTKISNNVYVNNGRDTSLKTGSFLVDTGSNYMIIQPVQDSLTDIRMRVSSLKDYSLSSMDLGVLMTYPSTGISNLASVSLPSISTLIPRLTIGYTIKNQTSQDLYIISRDNFDSTNLKNVKISNGVSLILLPYYDNISGESYWISNNNYNEI